ncbi:hydrolase [Planctomycetota bacterium]|nr:hydrolase [Planctomycetota bacterium]
MPAHRPAALLVDLDGTLVDSEPLHFEAHRRHLAAHGIAITMDDLHGNIGKGDLNFYAELMRKRGITGDAAAWVAEKTDVLLGIYQNEGLALGRGGQALVDWVVSKALPRMVVTNSERRLCVAALRAAKVDRIFHSRVVHEDSSNHKPHPAPYLLAAERFGVPAADCLAIEDSEPGVRAAVAAGCRTVGVYGLVPAATLQAAGAHFLVDQIGEVVRILEGVA